MFRLKLSKFKQAFAVAFLPRILVREFRPVKKKINNYTFDVFNKFGKSTDSGSNDEMTEKQRQIINKCFGEHELEGKYQGEEKEISRSPEAEYVRCSDSRQNEEKASYEGYNAGVQSNDDAATVKATTARIIDETLAQKMEKIDETPHVEAGPKDIEGFNSTPKVMGHDIEFFANEKIQQIDLDDLAKRCVGAPIGNIDELLIREMKNMSLKDCNSQLDMNLVRGHCVEKYYSGIFQHLTQQSKALDGKMEKRDGNEAANPLDLFYDNSINPDREMKSERITPLHTDSLHLFTIDEGCKDFKESGLIRDSCMDYTSDVKDTFYNQPEVLNPYGGPVFPFYEYGNKGPIMVEKFNETTTATVAEPEVETNMPEAQDIHLGKEDSIVRDIDPLQSDLSRIVEPTKTEGHAKEQEFSYITDKIRKMTRKEKVRPKVSSSDECSAESPFATRNQSYLKVGDIYLNPNQIGTLAKVEMLKLLYLNANKTKRSNESRLYSTPSEFSSGDEMNQEHNSAISGRLDQEFASREGHSSVELPTNSAISANQNPGEYYTLDDLHQSLNFLHEPWPTLTAECHNIDSALWTPLQKTDECFTPDSDDTIHELGYPIVLRDPFSYVCFQQNTPQKTVLDTLNEQISSATADKVTFSADADVTTKTDDGIPLSQVLKQIRNKNRLEFCRNLLLQCAKPNAKKLTCFPPLDKSKPRTTLYPRPCQPKPKKPDNKPEPCQPKKDPCAKFLPFFFSTLVRSEIAINIQAMQPLYHVCAYKTMVADEIVERLRNLYKRLQFVKFNRDIHYAKDANCARDFEPWIPIPSWPLPKVDKKRPFVCPKEGCKQFPVPQSNPPKQKPCPGMPRKRFSFAAINTPEILIN
ncbi:uncharacterized protein LOC116776797 [Danaus plexippus]|uniref:uncharacterized protein LOC116776797 n=1 Tax=Danaus plexippus TaxID=13037 RepID=UPI002AB29E31|nr:uncharacterized protein LOC116776797 [Danaus plexippus]